MEDEPTAPIPPSAQEGGSVTPPPATAPSATAPVPSWSPPPVAPKANPVLKVVGHRATGWIVAALLVGAVTGLSVALANTSSAPAPVALRGPVTASPPRAFTVPSGASGGFRRVFGGLGGVVVGRVNSVSASSFTVTSASGAAVRVDEQSSTTYRVDGAKATKASVKVGDEVFVLGTRSGTTVKAVRVIVGGTNGFGPYFFPG
jgi:hypothetical protein